MPRPLFVRIANTLEARQAANIFLQFPGDLRREFLELLEEKKKRQVHDLLVYPRDSAGQIMTVDFVAFHGDLKVKEAIQKIRYLVRHDSKASYIYVIDKEGHLTGVLRMKDLLLSDRASRSWALWSGWACSST